MIYALIGLAAFAASVCIVAAMAADEAAHPAVKQGRLA